MSKWKSSQKRSCIKSCRANNMGANIAYITMEKSAGYNLLTLEEWLRMPINMRIQLVKNGEVQFLNDKCEVIPVMEALHALTNKG